MFTEKSVVVADLIQEFDRKFGGHPDIIQAPGRVNLIGEHTDYNDGFVLPTAIQFQTSVAIAPRKDNRLVLYSVNYQEQVEFDLKDLPGVARGHWSDYALGVAHKLRTAGTPLSGSNLLILGEVPQGAGLSSSASLEVALCGAFLDGASVAMKGSDIARLCQAAENEFVGSRCGIMDQFVSVHGRKDHALLLDCRTLIYDHQPLTEGVRLVICNTMVRHAHAGGEYNQRREQCDAAVRFFQERKPGVRALRDVSMEDFQKYQMDLPEIIRKRARHVITENARVIRASDALAHHDSVLFGQLMWESHASLRDDFQVSCRELDFLVKFAEKATGVYGARMTGGGFGGCTVNLVKTEAIEEFRGEIEDQYERATGKRPEIYVCSASDGLRSVS